ncbi:ArsR/SmtB family transcription factor [Furfurilactobacillus entadae]|uniref:ArsR/SmtB family transcription factor n=1 Tax=Furfurilactobacillus entadae TaxID=2922307 RepID=UPI0035EFCFDF
MIEGHLSTDFDASGPFLTALGDEKRQKIIISLLQATTCEGLQVSDLTKVTGLSRPAVSYHLRILRAAKIIDYRTKGTKNFYYFVHETTEIEKLQHLLSDVVQAMTTNGEADK